jgi:hypothetical protein
MTSYTLDNVLQFLQLEQNNLLENPKILSRERNMAPDIKDKPSYEEGDSEIGSDVSLPFHLRMHMKTEFLYKEISIFLGEFPTTEKSKYSHRP